MELIEVKRWVDGDDSYFLVNKLEAEKKTFRNKPASGLPVYDEKFHKKEYKKESAIEFMKYAKQLENLVEKNRWDLELKFNKHYCSFKAGFFNAFAFFFNVSEGEAKQCPIEMTRYNNNWKRAEYFIEPRKTKTSDYLELFNIA